MVAVTIKLQCIYKALPMPGIYLKANKGYLVVVVVMVVVLGVNGGWWVA